MITTFMVLAIAAPAAAVALTAVAGWRRATAWSAVAASATVLASAIALWILHPPDRGTPHIALGALLRADSLSVCMLAVVGVIGTLSCLASIDYLDHELAHGHTTSAGARQYGVLIGLFLAAMTAASGGTSTTGGNGNTCTLTGDSVDCGNNNPGTDNTQPVAQGKTTSQLAETGSSGTTFMLIGAATLIAGGVGFRLTPRLARRGGAA